jgi:hypothetical protein
MIGNMTTTVKSKKGNKSLNALNNLERGVVKSSTGCVLILKVIRRLMNRRAASPIKNPTNIRLTREMPLILVVVTAYTPTIQKSDI